MRVRSTSDNTCSTSGGTITINAVPSPPSPPVASTTQPTCGVPSGTITFTAQTGVEYSVDNGANYQAGVSFTGLTPGVYTLRVRSTSDNTCSTSGGTITINAVPSPPSTPVASTTQPTCGVPSGTITFTAQTGVEYSVDNGANYQSGVSFTGLTPGVYTLRVRSTSDNTCSASGGTIAINAIPIPPPITFIDTSACKSFTMNTNTYTTSGIYRDTLISVLGCDSIIEINLTVDTLLPVLIDSNMIKYHCGLVGNFSTSEIASGISYTGGVGADTVFNWTTTRWLAGDSTILTPFGASQFNYDNFQFNHVGYGLDTIIIEVQNGACISKDSVGIQVLTIPVAPDLTSFAGNVCEETILYANTSVSPNGSYYWIKTAPFDTISEGNLADSAIITRTGFYLLVVDSIGVYNPVLPLAIQSYSCNVLTPKSITVDSFPIVFAGADQNLCSDTAILDGDISPTTHPVTWSTVIGGDGTFTDLTDTISVYRFGTNDLISKTVSLILTADANICPAISDTMEVNFTPPINVNAGSDVIVCANNDTINLTGVVNNATGGIWTTSGSGNFIIGGATSTNLLDDYDPSGADVIAQDIELILTSTGNGFCSSEKDTMKIHIDPAPTVFAGNDTSICGSEIDLSSTFTISSGVQWGTFGNATGTFSSSVTTNTTYTPTNSGTDTLLIHTTGNGICNATFDSIIIIFTSPITVEVDLFLEGAYTGPGTMRTDLSTIPVAGGQLALEYEDGNPGGYYGINMDPTYSVPTNAVDVIGIELRANPLISGTDTLYAWLMSDGTIMDFETGTVPYAQSCVIPTGNYHLHVLHRNHIAIMSDISKTVNTNVPPVDPHDFRICGNAYGVGEVGLGIVGIECGMILGNTVYYQEVNSDDTDLVSDQAWNALVGPAYRIEDVNMDAFINGTDYPLTRQNALMLYYTTVPGY